MSVQVDLRRQQQQQQQQQHKSKRGTTSIVVVSSAHGKHICISYLLPYIRVYSSFSYSNVHLVETADARYLYLYMYVHIEMVSESVL